MDEQPIPTLPKPDELLALYDVTEALFDTLRHWFDVPESVSLDLETIDSAVAELGDPMMIAALAMRKLQALHLLSTPGVVTTTDVIVTIVQDLDRALIQAPNMHLKRRAAATDWDAELAELDDPDAFGTESLGQVSEETPRLAEDHPSLQGRDVGTDPVDEGGAASDPEITAFRVRHGRLHEALRAVIEASEGEIRFFA